MIVDSTLVGRAESLNIEVQDGGPRTDLIGGPEKRELTIADHHP